MPSQLSETVIEEEMTDLWLSLRHQQPPLYHSTLVLIRAAPFLTSFCS